MKEKAINSKRVAEGGSVTKVRVEAKSEVRYWDVGILTDILHNVKAPYNGLKRVIVVSKEETKENRKGQGKRNRQRRGRRKRKKRLHYRT